MKTLGECKEEFNQYGRMPFVTTGVEKSGLMVLIVEHSYLDGFRFLISLFLFSFNGGGMNVYWIRST